MFLTFESHNIFRTLCKFLAYILNEKESSVIRPREHHALQEAIGGQTDGQIGRMYKVLICRGHLAIKGTFHAVENYK